MSAKQETVPSTRNSRSNSASKSAPKSASPGPVWEDYSPHAELDSVLVHALEAFVDNGYHATSVRDLARRLGQTVPAIYYHYENKQALLVALLSHSIDDLLERASAAAAEAPDDPKRRFELVVRCMVLFTAHRRQLAFLDAEIRSLEPKNRKDYVAKRDEIEALVISAVEDGMRRRLFVKGDAHAVARATITMVRGIANWYRVDGKLDPDSLAKLYVMFALRLAGETSAG